MLVNDQRQLPAIEAIQADNCLIRRHRSESSLQLYPQVTHCYVALYMSPSGLLVIPVQWASITSFHWQPG